MVGLRIQISAYDREIETTCAWALGAVYQSRLSAAGLTSAADRRDSGRARFGLLKL